MKDNWTATHGCSLVFPTTYGSPQGQPYGAGVCRKTVKAKICQKSKLGGFQSAVLSTQRQNSPHIQPCVSLVEVGIIDSEEGSGDFEVESGRALYRWGT